MSETGVRVRQRVLMLIPELGFGGAEKSFLRLYKLLAEHHEVSIVVFKRHYAKGGYTHAVLDIATTLTILDDEKPLGRIARWTARWRKLRSLKRDHDITISFLTGANMLNVVTGGPGHTVISMRGSRKYDPAFTPLKRFFYEYIIDPLTFMFADRIVSLSDGLTTEISAHVDRRTRNRIVTIDVFVDAEEMIRCANDPIEKEIEKLKGQPVIISAGRMSPEKGFQYLIPIFADVRRRIPSVKLVLIGDGPLHRTLVDLCEALNLPISDGYDHLHESAVIFLGYKKDPLRYFRIARVFVLSSLTEGFSNTVIEALAAGVPTLATDCPWGPRSILWKDPKDIRTAYPSEVPTQANYGKLMPRIDQARFHRKWVDTLSMILNNPDAGNVAAELGRDRVREFDSSRIGQKWLDLVDELGQSRSK